MASIETPMSVLHCLWNSSVLYFDTGSYFYILEFYLGANPLLFSNKEYSSANLSQ